MEKQEFINHLNMNKYQILRSVINLDSFNHIYSKLREKRSTSLSSLYFDVTERYNENNKYNYHIYPALIIAIVEGIIPYPTDGVVMLHHYWSCDEGIVPVIRDRYLAEKADRWYEDYGYEFHEKYKIKNLDFHYVDNDGQVSLTIKKSN